MTRAKRRSLRATAVQAGQALALRCAHHVARAIYRTEPEAAALAGWLDQNGTALGLAALDDAEVTPAPGKKRDVAVPASRWRHLTNALAAALRRLPAACGTPAELWLNALCVRLGLDGLERGLLSLTLHYETDDRVERLVDALSTARGSPARLHAEPVLLGLLLSADPAAVTARLLPGAPLFASGVLRLEQHNTLEVVHRLASLVRGAVPPQPDIYDQLLGSRASAQLDWDAFAHLGQQADVAAKLLRAALSGQAGGINLLLYGPPGTGKTSFAATLAARAGAQLRPVMEADEYGGEPTRTERLSGLRLAQRLAPAQETVLLFDEAEDAFVPRSDGFDGPVATSRVFMHRLLEGNPVPVIWTANHIDVLGPAVLRRMTMCLHMKVPGVPARTRLWRRMAAAEGVVLADADASQLARLVPAAPAVARTALRATRLAGGDAGTARLIVGGIAEAVAGRSLPPPEPEPDARYDPALVNADRDLAELADALARPGAPQAVSVLLSGPPGTGKSAWVRHLAARMGLPVLHKRASDLLSMWVGGTEQNIAAAFAEARRDGAFLVFDEADSLLAERADAVRSWEVSQVNEMLTWMESHPLPFACTTNLPDRLDRASLRRFLVKLRFGWLRAAQARLAFTQFFGLPAPAALDALNTLTPADFALVRRRAAFGGELADPSALLALLVAECDGRPGTRPPIGFRPTTAG